MGGSWTRERNPRAGSWDEGDTPSAPDSPSSRAASFLRPPAPEGPGSDPDPDSDALALDSPLPPSRRALRDLAVEALARQSGVCLVTGEPGAGKSWFLRRIRAEAARAGRLALAWAELDIVPGMSPRHFLDRVLHALGLDDASPRDPMLRLADFLVEQHQDGRRWALVIEEAHNLNADLMEEIRVLSNRIGRRDGFAALVLVGQTRLARLIRTRAFEPLDARLIAHFHLRPLDVAEAALLLRALWPDVVWPDPVVERIHAEAVGNPRRLLALGGLEHPRLVRRSPAAEHAQRLARRTDTENETDTDADGGFDPQSESDSEPETNPVPEPAPRAETRSPAPPQPRDLVDPDQLARWLLGDASKSGSGAIQIAEDCIEVGWGVETEFRTPPPPRNDAPTLSDPSPDDLARTPAPVADLPAEPEPRVVDDDDDNDDDDELDDSDSDEPEPPSKGPAPAAPAPGRPRGDASDADAPVPPRTGGGFGPPPLPTSPLRWIPSAAHDPQSAPRAFERLATNPTRVDDPATPAPALQYREIDDRYAIIQAIRELEAHRHLFEGQIGRERDSEPTLDPLQDPADPPFPATEPAPGAAAPQRANLRKNEVTYWVDARHDPAPHGPLFGRKPYHERD